MNDLWLPTGNHWGLNISHERRPDAGEFVPSNHKLTLHTVEGTSFSGARSTLIANRDEPHILVSVDGKTVRQFIPFNRSSKSLAHPSGTPETNRAGCIQIEICGFAHDSHNWTEGKMSRLAALCVLIEHRVNIERRTHCKWQSDVTRIPAEKFANWKGYIGHMHVPNNDHVDPGRFQITELFRLMGEAEKHFGG